MTNEIQNETGCPPLADPLEAPMQDVPGRREYRVPEDVLKRDVAHARADRYRRRLAEVEAVIEHNRDVMVEWAKRLGEAMALRERIERELSEALSAVQGAPWGRVTPRADEPVQERSEAWIEDGALSRWSREKIMEGIYGTSKPQPY